SALKPTHHFSIFELFCHAIEQDIVAQPLVGRLFGAEKSFDLVIGVRGPQKAALHIIFRFVETTRLVLKFVPRGERRAYGTAGIAGRGLDPYPFERAFAKDSAIGHTVQRHSSGETEVLGTGLAMQRSSET